MSFFKKLIGEAAAAPVKEIGKIIDNVHTSREEELSAEQKLTETVTSLQRLQAQITKSESQHRSIFVAGWRPACGWVCVTGLFFNFIVAPLLSPWVTIETSETGQLLALVLGLCGVAGYRTIEKSLGLTR